MQQAADQNLYEGIPKFFFCFPIGSLKTSCCFNLFSLKAGVQMFAIFDIILGISHAYKLLSQDKKPNQESIMWDIYLSIMLIFMIIPAIITMQGTAKSDAKKVSIYYYGKLAENLFLSIITLLESNNYCQTNPCNVQSFLEFILFIGLLNFLYLYQAHVILSYVNHVARGNTMLANNGQELTENMGRIRHSSAALQLGRNPAVVVGAPILLDGVEEMANLKNNPILGQV